MSQRIPQSEAEKRSYKCYPYPKGYTVTITHENDRHKFKKGDVVTIYTYGTYGAYTEDGEWVDFWSMTH